MKSLQKDLDEALHADGGDPTGTQGLSEKDLNELRQKTRQAEEYGAQIDEAIQVCLDTEALINKLGRYEADSF